MELICCSRCQTYLGWMTYTGPCGSFLCFDCKEESDRESDEEN